MTPPSKHRGVVLVLGLIFLAIASILTVSSMRTTSMQEKITSNQRNKTVALMSAEFGASRFLNWLVLQHAASGWPTTTAQQNAWQTATPAMPQTNAGTLTANTDELGYFWMESVDWSTTAQQVTIMVRGHALGGGVPVSVARVSQTFQFQPPPPPPSAQVPPLPAALTLGGPVNAFKAAESNNFSMRGGTGGPAIATSSAHANARNIVVDAIPSQRVSNYTGALTGGGTCNVPCVTSQDLGTTWSNPVEIQNLVNTLSTAPNVQFVDGSMDTNTTKLDNTKAVVVVMGNLTIRGGNYTSDGTGVFNGTVIVLGGTLDIKGGGSSTINGQVFVANMVTTPLPSVPWAFRSGTQNVVTISGGGNMTINYLPPPTGGGGGGGGGGGTGTGTGTLHILNWVEVDS